MPNNLPPREKFNFITFRDFVIELRAIEKGGFEHPVSMRGYCKIPFRHQGADDDLIADFKESPLEIGSTDTMKSEENSWAEWKA